MARRWIAPCRTRSRVCSWAPPPTRSTPAWRSSPRLGIIRLLEIGLLSLLRGLLARAVNFGQELPNRYDAGRIKYSARHFAAQLKCNPYGTFPRLPRDPRTPRPTGSHVEVWRQFGAKIGEFTPKSRQTPRTTAQGRWNRDHNRPTVPRKRAFFSDSRRRHIVPRTTANQAHEYQ